jgi:predicted RNA-binding protein with PUA domain
MIPTHNFSVPVDVNTVRSNGIVHPGDSVVSELHLDMPADKRFLLKNDLAMLAVIATSKWQRPICLPPRRN